MAVLFQSPIDKPIQKVGFFGVLIIQYLRCNIYHMTTLYSRMPAESEVHSRASMGRGGRIRRSNRNGIDLGQANPLRVEMASCKDTGNKRIAHQTNCG